MSRRTQRRARVFGAATLLTLTVGLSASPAGAITSTGPSTSVAPYLSPVAAGVDITSHLTVADATKTATNGYKMVGIPDGLGIKAATQSGNMEVFMNHELGATAGIPRAHGQAGSFVSKFEINPGTGEVVSGADAFSTVKYWQYDTNNDGNGGAVPAGGGYATAPGGDLPFGAAIGRLCSADMAGPAQLFNSTSGKGYNGHVFLTGEEVGNEARNFGLDASGTDGMVQLPVTGLFSWENTVTATSGSDATIAVGMEDGGVAELWVYQGTKTNTGNSMEKAGLTNGRNFAAKVTTSAGAPVVTEAGFRTAVGKGVSTDVTFTDVEWNQSGALQNAEAQAEGSIALSRIEDGAFDPNNPSVFYFVTTSDPGGLWKLTFNNIAVGVAAGAKLELVLDGAEIPVNDTVSRYTGHILDLKSPDNLTVDDEGHVLIQEDPGNNTHIARVLAYDIASAKLVNLAEFTGGPYNGGTTNDEESSGIVPTDPFLGDDTFLLDAQIHTASGLPAGTGAGTVQEFVEQGQLMSMKVNWQTVFGGPDPVVPEVPMTTLIPLTGALVAGGYIALRGRRAILS